MPVLMAIFAALGGIAFWRRRQIGDDARKISDAARSRVQHSRSGKKRLLTELGRHYYASSTNGDDVDHQAEMARIVHQLVDIEAESAEDAGDTTSTEEAGDATSAEEDDDVMSAKADESA